jgi:hypothetical protein
VKVPTGKLHDSYVTGFSCANAVKTKEAVTENLLSTPNGRTSLNKQSITINKLILWIFGEIPAKCQ